MPAVALAAALLAGCATAPPPPSAAPTDAAGSPVATRPPAPERTRLAIRLGPSGTVATVEAADREDGAIAITLRAHQPDGTEGPTLTASAVPPKGWRLSDDPNPRVTADGWLAVEVMDDEEAAFRTIVVDLHGGGSRVSSALEGTRAVWLPDGSLVTTGQVVQGDHVFDVVRRYPEHGNGSPLELRVEPPVGLDGGLSVPPDLSGVQVARSTADDRLERLVLRWDGSVVEPDDGVAPYAGLARQRMAGADGATVTSFCADPGGCGLTWNRPDGTSANVTLPVGVGGASAAWTPDGRSLVIVGGGAAIVARDGRPVPTVTALAPVRSLPQEALVVGTTPGHAIVQADDGVRLIALDGSGTVLGPFEGLAAGVVP